MNQVFLTAGYYRKKLYPRNLEKTFKAAVNEGKTLRIQLKDLVFDIKVMAAPFLVWMIKENKFEA